MVGTSLPPRTAPRGISCRIEARVLGGFEVIADGRRLAHADWQRVAAERLVKLLLITPGHMLSREAAAETLWPDAEPDASRANLRKAIHFASQALGDSAVLSATPGRVGFEPGLLDLDLDRLRAAFDQLARAPSQREGESVRGDGGSAQDPGGSANSMASRAIDVILALGPSELLPEDVYEEWLVAPREELRAKWARVAILAARQARNLGRVDDARAIADQLLDRDPTDEAAHRLVIELFSSEGRHHAARRQFDACRRALRDLLDAEPTPETVETFRAAERTASHEPGPAASLPRLVARHAELGRVESLLDRAMNGHRAALVIRGPTGIGKTRLLHEVVGYARAADWRVIEWQAVELAGTVAYAPLRHGLAEGLTAADFASWGEPARSGIAAIAPSLGLAGAMTFADRAALVEALVLALEELARSRPLVLAIDDLPWLDPATLELLGRLVAGQAPASILVAGTYRDDEPAPEPLRRLLDQVGRSGMFDLQIGPLAMPDMEALIVGNLGGASVEPELARRAFELSEGNPLFCLELVRAGRDRGTVRLAGERWMTMAAPGEARVGRGAAAASAALAGTPETVRRLVANRSARLTGPTLELVGTAAELGPEIAFATLEAVLADLEGGLLAALDSALSSGLLIERGGGYAFAHPLYRLAVRGAAGSARRAGTHLAIAQSFAGLVGDRTPAELERAAAACADPVTPAEHALTAAELGASGALPAAIAFGFAAAERAVRVFDPAAALLLERSLAAWQRLPRDIAQQFNASAAFASLGNVRMNAGDDRAATAAFRHAIAAARGPEELARAYTAYWWLPYRHADFQGCLAILEEALTRLPADAAVPRAIVQRDIGWTLGRLQRLDDSIERLADAVGILEASDARDDATRALDMLGMMLERVHRSDEAVERLERSLVMALELRDLKLEFVRLHLGTTLTRAGRPGRARPHLERALEIAHQMGDRYLESVAAWAAAEMEDAMGTTRPRSRCAPASSSSSRRSAGIRTTRRCRTRTLPTSPALPATTPRPTPRLPRRGASRRPHPMSGTRPGSRRRWPWSAGPTWRPGEQAGGGNGTGTAARQDSRFVRERRLFVSPRKEMVAMILVVGSTGSLGGQITRGLLAQGRPVRILVRPGSHYQPLVQAGALPVFGDLKERASLDAACRGVDTVVTTAISLGRGIDDTIESVDRDGNRSLVQAAADAGVRHFIFTSMLGVAPDSPNPFIAAKAVTEAAVGSSGMTWTILAPNAFMDVWLGAVVAGPALAEREVVYVGSGARRHSFVHSRDVAAFALAALDSPAAVNRYLPIGGPAPISIRDAVAIFEGVLGRSIPQRGVAPGDDVPGMPPFMAQMLAMQDTFDSPMEMAETAAEFGIRLTSVEEWAASLVPVAVG